MKLQTKNCETPECGTTYGAGRKFKLKLNSGLCQNVVRKSKGTLFNEWLMKRWMFTGTTGATASLRQDEPVLVPKETLGVFRGSKGSYRRLKQTNYIMPVKRPFSFPVTHSKHSIRLRYVYCCNLLSPRYSGLLRRMKGKSHIIPLNASEAFAKKDSCWGKLWDKHHF